MSNNILEAKFYTRIIGINPDCSPQIQVDNKLKRSLESYQRRTQEFESLYQHDDPQILVIYWMQIIFDNQVETQTVEMAWQYLQCFCEESIYKATRKVFYNDKYQQDKRYELMLSGLFIARQFVYNSEEFKVVINKYDHNKGLFEYYIKAVLENVIKDKLGLKFSTWRRLIKCSKKQLNQALANNGINNGLITKIQFALTFFKEVYIYNRIANNVARKSGDEYPKPLESDYEESVNSYNEHRVLPSSPDEVFISQNITTETLREWIKICNTSLSNYFNPESNVYNYQDNYTNNQKSKDADKINPLGLDLQLVIQRFSNLNATDKKIVILTYGFKMKQQDIGNIFSLTQTAISHRVKNIKIEFMDILIESLYQSVTPETWINNYIDNWLNRLGDSYHKPLDSNYLRRILIEVVKTLDTSENRLLELKYGQRIDDCQLTMKLNMTEEDLLKMINQIQGKLEQGLLKKLEKLVHDSLELALSAFSQKLIDNACLNLNICETDRNRLKLSISERKWQNPTIDIANSILDKIICTYRKT
jgi:DNA-directed RNA polymerase specialized sigma subunit